MNVGYVHLENDIIVTSIRTKKFPPKNVIAICPKDTRGNWITDIDVLDVVGKTATFNQAKFDAKQQLIADRAVADQAIKDLDIIERNQVNAVDVDSMVDNLTKSDLKRVLKWLIKRAR